MYNYNNYQKYYKEKHYLFCLKIFNNWTIKKDIINLLINNNDVQKLKY